MRKIRLTESQFNQLVNKCVKKALNEVNITPWDETTEYAYKKTPNIYNDVAKIHKASQMRDDWENEESRNAQISPKQKQRQMDKMFFDHENTNLRNTKGGYAMNAMGDEEYLRDWAVDQRSSRFETEKERKKRY